MQAREPEDGPRGEGAEPTGPARGSSGGWWRAVVTVAVLAAVWWPARPGGRDGFPLSSYPMFGYARAPTSVVDTVLGVGADGRRWPLSPELLAGVSQPKLALERIRDAIGGKRAAALCKEVAGRVSGLSAEERPVALEVVTDTWDTLQGFEPGAEPRRRVVHERCEVGG